MKIWFNKVHEAKRVLIESDSPEIRIGRDPTNIIVLQSPPGATGEGIARQCSWL